MSGGRGFIPENIINEVIERNDILSLVSQYVDLTRKSSSSFFGLCPFHNEKTPSFSVSPAKNMFYCFGCHVGGNAIEFVKRIENMSFVEAVRFLAKRAGIDIPENSRPYNSVNKKLYDLLTDCAKFFYAALIAENEEAAEARRYLTKLRGLKPAVLKSFGAGYADTSFDSLTKAMLAKGYTEKDLFDAGLAKKNERGTRDVFIARVVFPIINPSNKIVGFGGRIIRPSEYAPKYLNSPATKIYNKSRELFAIQRAFRSRKPYAIIAEGYLDVLSLHSAGFDSAVASLGTALTPAQCRLLKRRFSAVRLCYDGDTAGLNAAEKAIPLLLQAGFEDIRIVNLPGNKDPDDYIKEMGPDMFESALDGAPGIPRFLISRAEAKFLDAEEPDYAGYEKTICRIIADIESLSERQELIRQEARKLKVIYEDLDAKVRDFQMNKGFSRDSGHKSGLPRPPMPEPPPPPNFAPPFASTAPGFMPQACEHDSMTAADNKDKPPKLSEAEAHFIYALLNAGYSLEELKIKPDPRFFTPGPAHDFLEFICQKPANHRFSPADLELYLENNAVEAEEEIEEGEEGLRGENDPYIIKSAMAAFLVNTVDPNSALRPEAIKRAYEFIYYDYLCAEELKLRQELAEMEIGEAGEATQDIVRKIMKIKQQKLLIGGLK